MDEGGWVVGWCCHPPKRRSQLAKPVGTSNNNLTASKQGKSADEPPPSTTPCATFPLVPPSNVTFQLKGFTFCCYAFQHFCFTAKVAQRQVIIVWSAVSVSGFGSGLGGADCSPPRQPPKWRVCQPVVLGFIVWVRIFKSNWAVE